MEFLALALFWMSIIFHILMIAMVVLIKKKQRMLSYTDTLAMIADEMYRTKKLNSIGNRLAYSKTANIIWTLISTILIAAYAGYGYGIVYVLSVLPLIPLGLEFIDMIQFHARVQRTLSSRR